MHSVIEGSGRIVGTVLSLRQHFSIGGAVFSGRQGTDIAVDPEYQGQGVARLLMEMGRREVPRHYEFELHVGSRSRHPAMSSVRSQVYATSTALAHDVAVLVAPLAGPPSGVRTETNWSIAGVPAFDERIDAFLEAASAQFDLIVTRTRGYLNWRYTDPRAGRFRIRLAEQDGLLLGYSVLSSLRTEGYIADLLALPGRVDVAEALLYDALAVFREAGLQSGRCWAPHDHPYNHAFRGAGFIERKRGRHVTYRAYRDSEAAQALSGPGARVHLMIGDSDSV